jgi:hypothetical protein
MLESIHFPIKIYAGAVALSPSSSALVQKLSPVGLVSNWANKFLSAGLDYVLPKGPISDKNVKWISTWANWATFTAPVKAFQDMPTKYSWALSWLEYPVTTIGLSARKITTFVNQRSIAEDRKTKTVNAIASAAINQAKLPIPKDGSKSDDESRRTFVNSFKGKVQKILNDKIPQTPSWAQAAGFAAEMGTQFLVAWVGRYYFFDSLAPSHPILYYPAALVCFNIFAKMTLHFSARSAYTEAFKTKYVATVLTEEMVEAIKKEAGTEFQLVEEDGSLKTAHSEQMGIFADWLGKLDKIVEAQTKPKTPQKATPQRKPAGTETPAFKKGASDKGGEGKETKDAKKGEAKKSAEPPATPKKTPAGKKGAAATPATESTKKSASVAIKVPKFEDLSEKMIRGWKSLISSKIDMNELTNENALAFLRDHLKAVKKHKETAIDVENEELEDILEGLRKYIANEIKKCEEILRRASIQKKNKAMQGFASDPDKKSWSLSDLLFCCRSKKAAAPAQDPDESVVVKKEATPKHQTKKAEKEEVKEDEEILATPTPSDEEIDEEEVDPTVDPSFIKKAEAAISPSEIVDGDGLDSDEDK